MASIATGLVKQSRVLRTCCGCGKLILVGSPYEWAYGAATKWDPKYRLYKHLECKW